MRSKKLIQLILKYNILESALSTGLKEHGAKETNGRKQVLNHQVGWCYMILTSLGADMEKEKYFAIK